MEHFASCHKSGSFSHALLWSSPSPIHSRQSRTFGDGNCFWRSCMNSFSSSGWTCIFCGIFQSKIPLKMLELRRNCLRCRWDHDGGVTCLNNWNLMSKWLCCHRNTCSCTLWDKWKERKMISELSNHQLYRFIHQRHTELPYFHPHIVRLTSLPDLSEASFVVYRRGTHGRILQGAAFLVIRPMSPTTSIRLLPPARRATWSSVGSRTLQARVKTFPIIHWLSFGMARLFTSVQCCLGWLDLSNHIVVEAKTDVVISAAWINYDIEIIHAE